MVMVRACAAVYERGGQRKGGRGAQRHAAACTRLAMPILEQSTRQYMRASRTSLGLWLAPTSENLVSMADGCNNPRPWSNELGSAGLGL